MTGHEREREQRIELAIRGQEDRHDRGDEDEEGSRQQLDAKLTPRHPAVGILYPTLRLFAKNVGSEPGPLNVDVLFQDARGETRSLRIWSVAGHSDWNPTLPIPIIVNLLALLPATRRRWPSASRRRRPAAHG